MKHHTTDAQYDFNGIVGAKLAVLRKRGGASQQQIADVIELGRASIGNIEQGVQGLTAYNLWRLARFFGVSTDALLPGSPVADVTTELETELRRARRLSALLNRAKLLREHLDEIIRELDDTEEQQ